MQEQGLKKLPAIFYRNSNGTEPVRDWLNRSLKKPLGVDRWGKREPSRAAFPDVGPTSVGDFKTTEGPRRSVLWRGAQGEAPFATIATPENLFQRPVKGLSDADRSIIGHDIGAVEFGWPVGMPVCRALTSRRGLWEVRSKITSNRIARVLFCIHGERMVLLHAFIKKTEKTSDSDLDLAMKRKKETER